MGFRLGRHLGGEGRSTRVQSHVAFDDAADHVNFISDTSS